MTTNSGGRLRHPLTTAILWIAVVAALSSASRCLELMQETVWEVANSPELCGYTNLP